ncbi:MAG: carbon-nitrogen hydrolase family protein, partial [Saprospiraceae bacterium]|nr:carbon-nitrogen hydrolase family protein [Saprospiraceae bacterium]
LNKAQTLEKLLQYMAEAHANQADIIAVGETWFSGYPSWLDFCPNVALWDHAPTKEAYLLTYQNALALSDPEVERIRKACKDFNLAMVLGINERVENGPGNGSLYNTILTFGKDGELLNHHRKLVPTYTERLVHAPGDGAGLHTVRIDDVQVGSLICWEHWMPLTRQTLHNEGEHLHFCLWPWVHEKHQIATRHYAFEGRCYVVSIGQIMTASEIPDFLELPASISPDHLLLKGGSCVVQPNGDYLLEPDFKTRGMLLVDIPNFDACTKEKMTLDTSGHYQRNDVFELKVNKQRN